MLISNPNMMFLSERTDTPLLDLDVSAWLLLEHMAGGAPLKSPKEMRQFNLEMLLDALKDPICRGYDDENYRKRWWQVDDDHWSNDARDRRMKRMDGRYLDLQFRILARDMLDAKYPLRIGSYKKLNGKGRALVEFNMVCGRARYDLDGRSPDAPWRTFRDCDPSGCYSIMTGTRAAPLKCRWLDIDGQGKEDIVDTTLICNSRRRKKRRGLVEIILSKLRINR